MIRLGSRYGAPCRGEIKRKWQQSYLDKEIQEEKEEKGPPKGTAAKKGQVDSNETFGEATESAEAMKSLFVSPTRQGQVAFLRALRLLRHEPRVLVAQCPRCAPARFCSKECMAAHLKESHGRFYVAVPGLEGVASKLKALASLIAICKALGHVQGRACSRGGHAPHHGGPILQY